MLQLQRMYACVIAHFVQAMHMITLGSVLSLSARCCREHRLVNVRAPSILAV